MVAILARGIGLCGLLWAMFLPMEGPCFAQAEEKEIIERLVRLEGGTPALRPEARRSGGDPEKGGPVVEASHASA